ncbi:TolC family protein [Persephonella sp.]
MLENQLFKNNPEIKEFEFLEKAVQNQLLSLKAQNQGEFLFSFIYYPSSGYANDIIGYQFGIFGKWRYPIFGEYKDRRLDELFLYLKSLDLQSKSEETRLRILTELRKVYTDYYYSYTSEKKLKEILSELNSIKKRIQETYRKRLALKTDILEVETYISNLNYKIQEVQTEKNTQLAKLKQLTGLNELGSFTPAVFDIGNVYIPALEEILIASKSNRKDILLLNKGKEKLSEAVSHYSKYPEGWFNIHGIYTSENSPFSSQSYSGVAVSVDIRFPTFYLRAKRYIEKEKKLRLKSAEYRIKSRESRISTRIIEVYNILNRNTARAEYFRKRDQYYTESIDTLKSRIKTGLTDKTEGLIKIAFLLNEKANNLLLLSEAERSTYSAYFELLSLAGITELSFSKKKADIFKGVELHTYVWNTDFLGNKTQEEDFIKECKKIGVRTVYLSLNGQQIKNLLKNGYGQDSLARFLKRLKEENINSQLLLGENSWIYEENRGKLIDIIRLYKKFNEKYANLFSALHLDIEPHSLPDWTENREELLKLYLETLKEAKKNAQSAVYADISPQYLKIFLNGRSLTSQVLKITDGINVMAYSTNADYIIAVYSSLKADIEAERKRVIISVSFEDFLPKNQTLFYLSEDRLKEFISRLKNAGISTIAVQNFFYLKKYLFRPEVRKR